MAFSGTCVTLSDFCDSADVWQMFGLVWHHHEFLIITHWSLMDPLKPPKILFIKILWFYVSNDVLQAKTLLTHTKTPK